MLTCKEASYLASKKLDKNLSFRENLDFKLHTLMCCFCRRYASEISSLHTLLQKVRASNSSTLPKSVKLSQKSRHKIKQAIDEAVSASD